MKTSEQIDLISTALSQAQGEFPPIEKSRINPHFKSKFANLSDILSACVPILSKHGLAFSQGLSFFDGRQVITSRLLHKSGQWIESEMSIRPMKDDAQALGSATTYGRRYSAEAMLGVSATDDDDGEAATGNSNISKPAPKMVKERTEEPKYMGSAEQQIRLKAIMADLGITQPKMIIDINREAIGMPLSKIRDFVAKFAGAEADI